MKLACENGVPAGNVFVEVGRRSACSGAKSNQPRYARGLVPCFTIPSAKLVFDKGYLAVKQVLVRRGSILVQQVPAPQVSPKNILVRVAHSCISVGTETAGLKMSGLPLYRRALKQPH